jgi:molybdopterin biosynthesis enzyme
VKSYEEHLRDLRGLLVPGAPFDAAVLDAVGLTLAADVTSRTDLPTFATSATRTA